ncbi:unnamed protein product [Adineta steineri]|uniref:Uncharacterized protein n=1 Tax=Adineta steineri TaxID=433720 RepID=A0A814SYZ2_9BILA|nr:unnamed protein product [Adineta steineri]CAF3670350.1 unnamed protein product [Adineta steineri]
MLRYKCFISSQSNETTFSFGSLVFRDRNTKQKETSDKFIKPLRKYILFTEGLVERTCPYTNKTNIDCVRSIEIRLKKVIDNCATYFPNMTELKISYVCIQQNEVYQLISTRTNIKNLIINVKRSFEEIKLFVNLCPQLQRLMINTFTNCIESILRFLLLKNNTGHLSSLCLKNVSENEIEK